MAFAYRFDSNAGDIFALPCVRDILKARLLKIGKQLFAFARYLALSALVTTSRNRIHSQIYELGEVHVRFKHLFDNVKVLACGRLMPGNA